MKLYRSEGTEATCPVCHGGNAMLMNTRESDYSEEAGRIVYAYTCRDCDYTVVDPEIIVVDYADLIHRYRSGGKLLDVGCAVGVFLAMARDRA